MSLLREWYFQAVAQPTLFVLAGAPFAWLLLALSARSGLSPARALRLGGLVGLGVSGGVAFTVAFLYAIRPDLIDHVEPHVVTRAALWLQGHPLYHAWDEPSAFSTGYGPLSYLPVAAAFLVFGKNLFAAKLPGLAAMLLALVIAWRENRGEARPPWLAPSLQLALSALFIQAAFWTRVDPLLVLGVSAAMMSLRIRAVAAQAVILGILVGLLVNCKIHGPLYLLPLALTVLRRAPLKGTLIAILAAIPVVLAPFCLPGVPARAFLGSLSLMAEQTREGFRFWAHLQWFIFLLLPVALLAAPAARELSRKLRDPAATVALGLLIGGVATCFLAAKAGSGPWHLLPWVPWLIWLGCRLPRVLPSTPVPRLVPVLLACWIGSATLLVWTRQDDYIATLWKSPARAALSEIDRIAALHPGAGIRMGLGENSSAPSYAATFMRTRLVFLGHDSDFDPSVLMDMASLGRPVPPHVQARLLDGHVDLFLIPRGEEPFSLGSVYDGARLFPDEFRLEFARRYARIEQGTVYDVWIKR
jgi:hypothetical protein